MPTFPNINYVDGLSAGADFSIYCFNTDKTYVTQSGDPSEGAVQTETRNSDGQLIGSITFVDGRKGSIAAQYDLLSDEAPGSANMLRPSYIISFRGRFFVIGEVKSPIVKNDVVKLSFPVIELQNPFIPGLLSLLGQLKKVTATFASLPETVDAAASNIRPGATVSYTVESAAGGAAPAGITINAATGLVTAAAVTVVAGTYVIRVIVKDSLVLADGTISDLYGFGLYILEVT